jgi:hypothetical protein
MSYRDDEWARRTPWPRKRGPYEDYGWEKGQSVLPQFRDPSVSRMPYEPERNEWQRRFIERENPRYSQHDYEEHDFPNLEWEDDQPYVGLGPDYYQRPDQFIYEDVCDGMMMHGYLNARHIRVNVKDGQVTLEGKADSRKTKRLAEDLAFDIWGVKDVHNRIQVERENDRNRQMAEGQRYPSSGTSS